MKLKKIAKVLLSAVIAGVLFTGCGQDDNADNKENTSASSKAKLGMISKMNVSEENYNSFLQKYETKVGRKFSYQIIFYDDLNSMQLGLQSKNIDAMSLYTCVGNYIVSKDSKTEIVKYTALDLTDSFCFAIREEDSELKDSFDGVIKSMKDDGTLDNLVQTYITDLKEDPPAVDIKNISGADTIKVGITGDLPPLDLVLANGQPAGFNTAVLSEISKRINKNIELIQIDSAARAAALTSKQVDVVFWVVVPQDDKRPADMDKPAGVSVTTPYYQDEVVHIGLKK